MATVAKVMPHKGEELGISSFAPLTQKDVRILILGSIPGQASLRADQYYAHPRNQFWSIVEAVFGIPRGVPYPERVSALTARGVAVWDVVACCTRPGSMDADIDARSVIANDIRAFIAEHPQVRTIAFNGAAAERYFQLKFKHADMTQVQRFVRLPSTSPANAGMSFNEKLNLWRGTLLAAQAISNQVQPDF